MKDSNTVLSSMQCCDVKEQPRDPACQKEGKAELGGLIEILIAGVKEETMTRTEEQERESRLDLSATKYHITVKSEIKRILNISKKPSVCLLPLYVGQSVLAEGKKTNKE